MLTVIEKAEAVIDALRDFVPGDRVIVVEYSPHFRNRIGSHGVVRCRYDFEGIDSILSVDQDNGGRMHYLPFELRHAD